MKLLRKRVRDVSAVWVYERKLPELQAAFVETQEVQNALKDPQILDPSGTLLMVELKNGVRVPKASFLDHKAKMRHPIKGIEDEFIDIEIPEDAHVGYFGSGSDLFRLLHDFPEAKHFHFYDVIDYWSGNKKRDLISELQSAAQSLAIDGRTEIVSRGFLDHVPETVMDSSNTGEIQSYFIRHLPLDPELSEPYVFRFQFGLKGRFENEVYVYLNPIDYLNEKLVERAMAALPDQGKTAAFIWGVTSPIPDNPNVISHLTHKLMRNSGELILVGRSHSRNVGADSVVFPVTVGKDFEEVSVSGWKKRVKIGSEGRVGTNRFPSGNMFFVPVCFAF